MIAGSREIRILEFERIRERLARLTFSPLGREKAAELQPVSSPALVRQWQQETNEARDYLSLGRPPLVAVREVRPLIDRAQKGGILAAAELADLRILLQALKSLKMSLLPDNKDQAEGQQNGRHPLLQQLAAELDCFPALQHLIDRTVSDEGDILDGASPALAELRYRKLRLDRKIRESAENFLRRSDLQKAFQEHFVTIRNGRHVLPVKLEYRHLIQGVEHDQSASGATVFIEPLPLVALQNELLQVVREEEKEIARILQKLSRHVAAEAQQLALMYERYAGLDLIFARGGLSLEMNAVAPALLEDRQAIKIVQGRHPLLEGEVVPIDLALGDSFRTLVITGPNTGGKTVILKTIGLFALMVQAGLHLPCADGTAMAIMEQVLADIGDEQSIEQSLSTFSGHLRNIKEILQEAGERALVLLDELGAGTDPQEGAALAMALLDEFHRRRCLTVATTHYSDLKIFAHQQPGMENASVEFDVRTLSPTYRIFVGIAGQSNALAIARRLGLPGRIIDQARSYLTGDALKVEEMISSLARQQKTLEQRSSAAQEIYRTAQRLQEQLEQELSKMDRRREEIIGKARREAEQIVRQARNKAEEIIRELQELQEAGGQDALRRAQASRRALKQLQGDFGPQKDSGGGPPLSLDELKVSMAVYVTSLRMEGTVLAVSEDGDVEVQVGKMRVTTTPADLQHAGATTEPQAAGVTVSDHRPVPNYIDLRGLTVEEAVEKADKYLDDALLSGWKDVTLIHGFGTGKLRRGLQDYLKLHEAVDRFRPGGHGEGGGGVTVVSLKQQ